MESIRSKLSPRYIAIILVTFFWLFFQLYVAFVRPLKPLIQNPLHLLCALAVVVLYAPLSKRVKGRSARLLLEGVDIAILAALLFVGWYLFSQGERLEQRIQFVNPLTTIDYIAMVCLVLVLLECVRRAMGMSLLVFILIFLAYFWLGPYMPGMLRHSGTSLSQFTDLMIMGNDGIFGTPLGASVNFLYYFIFFGAFLADYGGGRVLIDLGMKVGRKGAGGPAKAAVMSSGLMGMISGSAVANVTTTGVMTIPLMKKVGYSNEEAGAIEAVASTGGQIMPPIMGVGAFLMAEIVGIPYGEIALRALVPALVYYLSVLLLVDFLARKKRLTKVQEDASISEILKTDPIVPRLYLLLPVVVIVYYIIDGRSLMFAAVRGTIMVMILNIIQKLVQKRGLGVGDIYRGILNATKQVSEIAIPTGACGLIIGTVVMSGLATKMSNIISGSGGTSMLVSLIVAMLGCLVLGMALPTVAAYLSAYVLFVPSLVKLGLTPYLANMFLFYFGIFAQITPPVALASYAGAGIAGGDTWKTGWLGFRFALVAFLVPFVFVYNPGILLIGTPLEIALAIFTLSFGTFFLVVSVSGYLLIPITQHWFKALILATSIAIIIPETISSSIGTAVGIGIIVYCVLQYRKSKSKAMPGDARAQTN